MKLSTLRANPTNPRIIKDEKFQKLVKSIEEFPEMLEARPIVVNPEMVVIGGNMRFKACKAAGLKEAPVYMATWGETKDREFIIKDNVSSGENDFDILANEWDAEELNEWGLDVWTGEPEETEGLTDPDDVPEAPEEPKAKLGDLYILGEHRLLCGDSTKAEDVEKLMNGEKADALITDPPYGVSYKSPSGKGLTNRGDYDIIKGDNVDFDPSCLFGHCESVVTWGANHYANLLPPSARWLVWDKREGDAINKNSDCELAWCSQGGSARLFHHKWNGMIKASERQDKRMHPTQKPIALFEWVFECIESGNLILDLFLGSGSTLIAAEKTNRKCYGMELDPKYCDVIVKRWEDFTGKKASKQ
jgi:DNA modification methylase|tara:strand:- start:421 stop:1503 length:1083 start_codon:yes stop_codon:yes gene_type:complete